MVGSGRGGGKEMFSYTQDRAQSAKCSSVGQPSVGLLDRSTIRRSTVSVDREDGGIKNYPMWFSRFPPIHTSFAPRSSPITAADWRRNIQSPTSMISYGIVGVYKGLLFHTNKGLLFDV